MADQVDHESDDHAHAETHETYRKFAAYSGTAFSIEYRCRAVHQETCIQSSSLLAADIPKTFLCKCQQSQVSSKVLLSY